MSICGRVRGTRKCLLLSVVLLSVFVSLAQGKAPPRPTHPKLPLAERIADGYYYSKTIKLQKHLLPQPELLDQKSNEEVEL